MYRVGQNLISTPYMTVVFLPKIPYIHHIYMVLANLFSFLFWPTIKIAHPHCSSVDTDPPQKCSSDLAREQELADALRRYTHARTRAHTHTHTNTHTHTLVGASHSLSSNARKDHPKSNAKKEANRVGVVLPYLSGKCRHGALPCKSSHASQQKQSNTI